MTIIPFTDIVEEAIESLKKYGHDLEHIIQYGYTNSIYFECKICGSDITLKVVRGELFRLKVDGSYTETADFYCEKYRALYE